MLKSQRHKNIINLLSFEEYISVVDLSKKTCSSQMTIRRDLDYLESEGLIKKVHGGAILINPENSQYSLIDHLAEFKIEKDLIGKEAVKLIRTGDVVFFDPGTTHLSVVEHVPGNLEFTAITTGLITALKLCKKQNVNVISIGGNIDNCNYSSINHVAVEIINKFNADIAFISTAAVSIPAGTFETSLPLIEIKKNIVSVSKKIVLLADHSKFENKALSLSIPFNDIDIVITDNKTPAEIIKNIRNLGIEVIIPDS